MNGVGIPAFPAAALKAKRVKKGRHKAKTAWVKEEVGVHKVALGISHKEVFDRLFDRVDWAKYYNPDGSLKTGKRLPRDFWCRHPELNPPSPRMPQ